MSKMNSSPSVSSKVDGCESKKKKGDKSIELLKKNISEYKTEEEKIDYLCNRYSELIHDYKELKSSNQSVSKQLTSVQKDKDHITKEHNKVLLQKANLENLSRELQRQKQFIQDESLSRYRQEEEKRKEISGLFRSKISEIESQMSTYQESNDKLRQENMELAGKLSKFIEQFELKEQHSARLLQTKALEAQLMEAKNKQSQALLEELMTKMSQEKECVDRQSEEYVTKIRMHQEIEDKMKEQIEFYRSRYEEFQTTMTESNQVFATCKKEMDKMSSMIKKLEKENSQLKQKWENSNCSAIVLASEKAQAAEHTQALTSKVEKLEGLCRALQLERSEMRKKTALPTVESTVSEVNKIREVAQPSKNRGDEIVDQDEPSPLDKAVRQLEEQFLSQAAV